MEGSTPPEATKYFMRNNKPIVFKRAKNKPIPKEYSYCSGCKEFTLSKGGGMCSDSCCCDKIYCRNCSKVFYVEYD